MGENGEGFQFMMVSTNTDSGIKIESLMKRGVNLKIKWRTKNFLFSKETDS